MTRFFRNYKKIQQLCRQPHIREWKKSKCYTGLCTWRNCTKPRCLQLIIVFFFQPLWMFEPKEITPEQHKDFYRFVSNSYDLPRFTLHYKTDVPLSIRALFYFPDTKPSLFDLSRDTSTGVTLYSRKVMIISKAENILPKWLRFVKGVVDSEDIPLNLSRELLQNSALIGSV